MAFTRQKETSDVDALVSDSLDTIAEAIGMVQELTTAAAQGSYPTKYLNQIPWETIQTKYAAAKPNGYSPLFDSSFRHASAQETLSVISIVSTVRAGLQAPGLISVVRTRALALRAFRSFRSLCIRRYSQATK